MRKQLDVLLGQRGSQFLMWLVIAVILASPLSDNHPNIGAALALIVLFSVMLGARLSANKKIIIRVVLPLAGLWILARLLEGLSNRAYMYNVLAHASGLALSGSILWGLFNRLHTAEVTKNVIAEAFISYLVIAFAYSQLYWILNEVVTNAFNQKVSPAQSTEFLYFSMISISGVGYGGVLPVNPFVRIVAAFESMTGIFYVAIVVARLVSAYRPLQRQVDSAL
jgi:Ion channel